MMNHSIYSSSSSFIPSDHHESLPSYNSYAGYPDYPHPSKLETYDYGYWPTTTTTHNLLSYPNETVLDQIPITSSSVSSRPMESLVPTSTLHLTPIDSTTTIAPLPSTHHHHHHIHQHVYPQENSCSTPPNSHVPTSWISSGDYEALHSTTSTDVPSSYRHYSTPCSLYPNNHFYNSTPPTLSHQWPMNSIVPIKFESPYSPPPSYFESSDSFNQPVTEVSIKEEEKSDSFEQTHWSKPTSTSTPLAAIPPRNPLNGKTRTRDKYRIVYTDHQRTELENEFSASHYISIPRKAALSLTLKLSERQIKIWFQNRRAKERKLNKKRQEPSGSTRRSNHSNEMDSQSDDEGQESPAYYGNYSS